MDAWALTDHGNGNGHAHARSAALKLQKKGVKYRQLYGVEFYFVPSLAQWRLDYEAHKQSIKDAKTAAEAEKKAKIRTDLDADEVAEEEEAGGHVVEDEAETKADDYKEKPDWQRRYHLVAVAKNRNGLSNIYRLVKASFKDGFYRYPRIDFDLLRRYGGDIVWSTACLGGLASGLILRGEAYGKSSEEIIGELLNMTDRFTDAVGRENFFLELQFNKLPKQHIVNRHLIDLSRRTGLKLLATCDSHYPDPSKWQARELYKKLGWMGAKLDTNALPKFEDLKCELYPKNASQMWDEYRAAYEQYEFYRGSEEEVRDAIERTHDIAWQECEDAWIDTKAKLPHFGTSEKSSFRQLIDLLKEKLEEQGYAQDQVYVSRLKEELEVVKAKEFADYFLTLYSVLKKAAERAMVGPGRGSGTGSLINYLLGITNVDPIKYDLLFSRFINMGRKGFPDVDCLHEDHLVVTGDGKYKRLGDIVAGEVVLGGDRSPHTVTATCRRRLYDHEPPIVVFVRDNPTGTLGSIRCIPRHKFVKSDGSVVYAHDLSPGDSIMSASDVTVVAIEPDPGVDSTYVDVTVADDHRFVVVPFDVIENDFGLSSDAYSISPTNRELLHP